MFFTNISPLVIYEQKLYSTTYIFLGIKVGLWKSNQNGEGLEIQDIVWPENSHVPPEGVPERFHLTIGFLPEPPFIHVTPPDPITNKCHVDRGVVCLIKNATTNEYELLTKIDSSLVQTFTQRLSAGLWLNVALGFALIFWRNFRKIYSSNMISCKALTIVGEYLR